MNTLVNAKNRNKVIDEVKYAIEYLKSSLSISTYVGCGLGCSYCSVQEFATNQPVKVIEAEELVNILLEHPLFITHKTPITINNRTDPMLPGIKEDTFKILSLLEKQNISNPRIIISKMYLSPGELEFLESLAGPIFYIVSYSNLPKSFEAIDGSTQRRTMETLKNRKKVVSMHYWRPMIEGLNDSEVSIKEVMDLVESACDGSIISGLRLNENIFKKMVSLGAVLDDWNGDTQHKYIAKRVVEKLVRIRNEMYPHYPLFRHTSCGISTFSNKKDYNFHFQNSGNCLSLCPNQINCQLKTPPSSQIVAEVLKKMRIGWDWRYEEDHINILGEINEQERSGIMHAIEYPVRAERVVKAPSEEVLAK